MLRLSFVGVRVIVSISPILINTVHYIVYITACTSIIFTTTQMHQQQQQQLNPQVDQHPTPTFYDQPQSSNQPNMYSMPSLNPPHQSSYNNLNANNDPVANQQGM